MFFVVIALIFGVCAAFNADGMQKGIACWTGSGLSVGENGIFGIFRQRKCAPETKSCFSASFITVHGDIFVHRKGCADASGCSPLNNANFEDFRGIAKQTECSLCFKSGCNKPKTFNLDVQLGEIECISELMVKSSNSNRNWNGSNVGEENEVETTDFWTLKLPPKRIRCSAHSSWCVSAKCTSKTPKKLDKSSFLFFNGCAMPKMTRAVMNQLCANVINGEMEFFRFFPGTKIGRETEGFNISTKSISFDF